MVTPEDWRHIDDDLFAQRVLQALRRTCAAAGCNLMEALTLVHVRYEQLRADHPDRFSVGPEDYWANCYS